MHDFKSRPRDSFSSNEVELHRLQEEDELTLGGKPGARADAHPIPLPEPLICLVVLGVLDLPDRRSVSISAADLNCSSSLIHCSEA
jgi:hypothetical protein